MRYLLRPLGLWWRYFPQLAALYLLGWLGCNPLVDGVKTAESRSSDEYHEKKDASHPGEGQTCEPMPHSDYRSGHGGLDHVGC